METLRASGFYVGDGFSEVLDGGALSDKEFSVGTNSYTIDLVFVKPASSAETGKLTFSLTSALTATDKEKLVLHVGSASFAFSDRTPDASHHYLWTWTGTGLDWSSTSEVTLRLQLRPDSTDATLSGLAVNDGSTDLMLNPGFAPDEDTYTASVASTVAEVTVTPTTTDDGATIEYLNASNMTLADAGTEAGQQVALAVGANVIKVKVTAEDGTTKTYAVTVHRVSPTCTLNTGDLWCGVVTVGALKTSGSTTGYGFSSSVGHLSDTGFSVGTNPYTIDTTSVGAAGTSGAGSLLFSLTSDLAAADAAKLVLHVGSAEFAFSDAFGPSGTNTYSWFLTGLDWSSEPNVTLRLRDSPISTDATLSGLAVNDGSTDVPLTPTFASGTTSYTASVANAVAELTVTPTTTDDGAAIKYLNASDMTLADAGTAAGQQVVLAVGANVIKVKVTAEDGTTTRTYTVTATRAPTCTPNTAAGDIWCGVVTVGAIESSGSTFAYGFSSSVGNLSDKEFSVGTNDYTSDSITVAAPGPGASGAGTLAFSLTSDLTAADKAKLVLHVGSASFAFSDAVGPFSSSTYSWPLSGQDWSSVPNVTLRLRDGSTPDATDATLSGLVVNDGSTDLTLSPGFESDKYTYTAMVASTVAEVTVTPTKNDTEATIEYLDASDMTLDDADPSVTGQQVAVAVGSTVINVKVTAADTTTTQTYAVTVNRAATAPGKPTGLTATASGSTQIDLTWTAPTDTGGSAITGYKIEVSTDGSTWTDRVADTGNDGTSYSHTGLAGGDTRHYRVSAINAAGTSDPSDAVSTNTDAPTAPGKPTGLTATASGSTQIDLTWTAPASDGGSAITGYKIEVSTDGSTWTDRVADTGNDGTSYSHTGLAGGDTRHYRVSAINAAGTSEPSDAVSTNTETTTTTPTIASVAVTSTPLLTSSGGSTPDTYGAGEDIEFTVTFSAAVEVTGDPQFGFSLAGPSVADLDSGISTTTALVFVYTVQPTDQDDDGIWVGNHASGNKTLQLDADDAITSLGGTDANLEHDILGRQDDHKVDGSRTTDEMVVIPPGLEVTLQLSDDTVLENATPVTVTATVSPASPAAFTVTISATPVAPATDEDFELSANRVLRFAANATESTGTVTIRTVDDDVAEPTDVVRVSGAVSNAAIPDPDDVTVSIVNDDPEAFDIAVSAPAAVDEDAGAAVVTVTLTTLKNTAPTADIGMFYRVERGGTATRGADYTPPPGDAGGSDVHYATVRPTAFSPNAAGTAWVAAPSFTIGIIDDQEAERDETIVFAVLTYDDQSPAHTITLRDNDATPAVSIAADTPTVVEEQPAAFTLTRTGATGSPLTVTVAVSEQADRDLLPDGAATERTVRFGAGAATTALTVALENDRVAEPDGDLTVAVQAGAGYTLGAPSSATVTVEDGDTDTAPPTVTSVVVASTPHSGDTYRWGETIVFTVTFSEPVRVTGRPWLDVGLDNPAGASGSTVRAGFWGLSDDEEVTSDSWPAPVSRHVHFGYSVQPYDIDADGVSLGANALQLASGDRIQSDETDTYAEFAHAALGRQSGHLVDGRTTVDGEPTVPVVEAGITFVDTDGNPLKLLANGTHRLSVPEGGEARYGLRLKTRPAHKVVVSHHYHTYGGDSDLTVPRNFSFDGSIRPDTWDTQTAWVRVAAAQDDDAEDGERVFDNRAFSRDPNYHDLMLPDVVVVEADDEAKGSSPGGAAEPLTAAFEGLPEAHDGATAFTFRLAFSEAVAVTPEAMRTRVLTVAGGAVTGAARVDGASGVWAITVTPDTREALSISLAPAADCAADGAVCTADGRALSIGAAHIVGGPGPDTGPAPLTATFPESVYASAQHKGPSDRPQVVVAFSAPVAAFGADTPSVSATGASVDGVQRLDKEGLEHAYVFFLTPEGHQAIVFRLHANRACTDGGICTADRRQLSNSPSATVAGPADDAPEPNTAAAGAPTINGTPQVGEALTASTSDISDADGLDDARFAYQWMRAGADIQGATGSTYTPVDADEGERLTVRVSFTDDAGNDERLTSAATDAVAAAPPTNTAAAGAPTIGGTPQVGEALTASTSGISDADGLDDARFAYQWMRAGADIGGATGSTYTPVDADEGKRLTVRVSFTDDAGNDERLTSATTDAVAASPPTNTAAAGAPTIGGTPQVGEALTASTSGISDADGLDTARFAYQWMRNGADIRGATGSTYTAVDADEGERLQVRVDFTDDAGNAERLTSAATDAVAARPEPLTASFEGLPAEHAGQGSFSFRVAFSEGINISYKTVRDASFRVTGGDVTQASRVDGRRDLWKITVEPASDTAVTVRLPETSDCGARGAICTGDGRGLSHALSATVAGPVGVTVADARVEEGANAVLAFAVTLSRAASAALTVDYATADGSAHAGDDYTAARGTLTFRAGESSKTIEVAVLDDAHDEGEETLTLRLSNPSGGRLADGEATGTIKNHDPMPRALLARFGRTAAVHVVEHVEERLAAPREPGFRGRFAGRELRRGMERDIALNFLRQLGGTAGAGPLGAGAGGPLSGAPAAGAAALGMPGPAGGGGHLAASGSMGGAALMGGASGSMGMASGPMGGAAGPDGRFDGGGLLRMGLGGGDVLTGSDFALGRETGHGGILSFWSRGAQSRFSGREGALSLGGDVRTTMFGADYAKGPVVTGLSLSHSRGLGEYAGVAGGQVASSVTGLYPWLGYKATDRITVWGVAGYGAGGLLLTPAGGPALESGLSMAMAAAGTRGELLAGGGGGFELAFKADALWVGTSIDGVDGAAGRMAATAAAVTRFRTGLEGSRDYTLAGRLSLKPSVEVGLRHDGGDAENGAGMDVGGGLVVSDASTGLARRPAGADAGDAPGRGVPRAGHGGLSELQPEAVDAAGLCGAGGAVVGRPGDERGRGAVGPGDDGGAGARRPRVGQPPRWRGRLRAGGGQPLRGDAHARRRDLRRRAGLPAGLPPRRARRRGHGVRAGRRRAAPGAPPAGRHGSLRARAGHAALVAAAPGTPAPRPGPRRRAAHGPTRLTG